MRTKFAISRGHVRTIEDAREAWRSHHDEAMGVRDLEDVIAEFTRAVAFVHKWHSDAWQALWHNELSNIQEAGRSLQKGAGELLRIGLGMVDDLQDVALKGYTIDNRDGLRKGVSDLRLVLDDINQTWPFLDMTELRQTVDHSEYLDAETLLHELQSENSP